MATTTETMPTPCGPYLQVLLTKAAEALDYSQIPAWDAEGQRNLQGLRQGRWQPYWTGRGRRHLSRTDVMACAALASMAAAASGPAWANTEAADAQRLADAIREGRCAVW
jgi:hypothetical protein